MCYEKYNIFYDGNRRLYAYPFFYRNSHSKSDYLLKYFLKAFNYIVFYILLKIFFTTLIKLKIKVTGEKTWRVGDDFSVTMTVVYVCVCMCVVDRNNKIIIPYFFFFFWLMTVVNEADKNLRASRETESVLRHSYRWGCGGIDV